MRPVDLPESSSERWDLLAVLVKEANGMWVVVGKYPDSRRGGRNEKAVEALTRRGLAVEVRSRKGDGSTDRPWSGWWTFARLI